MTWIYKGKPFTSDMIGDYVGFVYVITDKSTGKKYVGKKRLVNKKTLPPLKGKKNRRIRWVESDWQTYYGSSENVKLLLEKEGEENFEREILYLCETFGEMSYLEAKEQFDRQVLLSDEYYNAIINCRINETTVKHMKKG